MKLSSSTANLFEYYKTINNTILLEAGNLLRSMSPSQTVYVTTKIQDTFPADAGIYDLGKFMSVLKMFNLEDTEIEFHDTHLTLVQGEKKAIYKTCMPNLIMIPDRDFIPEQEDIVCRSKLLNTDLQSLLNAMRTLKYENISIAGEDGNLYLKTLSVLDRDSDIFSIRIGKAERNFTAILDASVFKIIPDDYILSLDTNMIHLRSKISNYWITLSEESDFD